MKRHVFESYFRKHGHYPRISVSSGVQRLTVEFAPGYVRISTSSPMQGCVYITRSAWFEMLKKAVPLTRKWTKAKDWDVPNAVHQAYLLEMKIAAERRAAKRARKGSMEDVERRRRQRKRFLRAQARSAERQK